METNRESSGDHDEKKERKIDLDKILPEHDEDTGKWLGEKLMEKGNELLNDSKVSREAIIVRFLIQTRNFELAQQEISELKEEIKRLERDLNILKRD